MTAIAGKSFAFITPVLKTKPHAMQLMQQASVITL
jgi:hypothetical protein